MSIIRAITPALWGKIQMYPNNIPQQKITHVKLKRVGCYGDTIHFNDLHSVADTLGFPSCFHTCLLFRLIAVNAAIKSFMNDTIDYVNRNRSRRFWFRLTVLPAQSPELEPRTTYSQTCFTEEACTLMCPTVNTPAQDIPNMTTNEIVWHKVLNNPQAPERTRFHVPVNHLELKNRSPVLQEGESSSSSSPYYISSVEEKDGGIYTCVRSYLYGGQMYNMTFAVALDVQPGSKTLLFDWRPCLLKPL